MADHAPFYLSLQSSVRFPFYSIDWCLAPPCLAVLSAAKLDKSSLPFGARPVGLSGLKNFKGSIPFGAWLGLRPDITGQPYQATYLLAEL